jgi:hypothetical protein
MSVSSLKVLQDNRDAMLLAELAAWLHDVGKFCNLHIEAHTIGGQRKWSNDHAYKAVLDNPRSVIRLSKAASSISKPGALNNVLNAQSPKAADFISAALKGFLQSKIISLFSESYYLGELIMLGTPGFATDSHRSQLLDGKSGWLAAVLGVCHNEAHVDKEDPPQNQGDQKWPDVFISTAFGYEKQKVVLDTSPESLDSRLRNLPIPQARDKLLEELSFGLGDTRRPVNEVVLSDWGWMVASLLKSACGGALLTNQQSGIRQWKNWKDKLIDHDLRWRLLRVNFDVLSLYAKAVKIGDLLGYQRAVEQACASVKKLVEEEYPLGNEIYRDSTGIYFTFPDLELPTDLKQEIRRCVEAVEPELAPRIDVTVGKGNTASEQLKSILSKAHTEAQQELKQPFDAQNLNQYWKDKWEEAQREPGKWEVCPVCSLRPKREDREICETCKTRRRGRMQEWLQALNNPAKPPQPTIWTNEVADRNGRLALLAGKFELDGWLSGDLVQTMLVKVEQNNPNGCVPKNPSPARLRRVWETTQRFWETALDEINEHGEPLLPFGTHRLILAGNLQREADAPDLQEQPICELQVEGFKLSVVWHEGRFIVCDNPAYFQTITGKALADVLQNGASFWLSTSEGYKKKDQKIGKFTIGDKLTQQTSYYSFIPILAEPQIFMALVPADRALEVVKAIRAKYEREMGKVQNRLPLHLGMVFATRRMPLQAILEAGQAMLKRSVNSEQWTVVSNFTCEKTHAPDHLKASAHFEQWQKVSLKNPSDREITLPVSTVMGDGTTQDVWYPYWQLQKDDLERRTQCFKGTDGKPWVHVCDLKEGDSIYFTPSTFDFEFLDSASRRFEVYYDEKGRRPRRTRPFFLQDVERMENLWNKHCCHLKHSQFSQMLQTIEAARQGWNIPLGDEALKNDVFRRFVEDTLANVNWPKGHPWKGIGDKQKEQLIDAAVRGELADWAELHLEILKEEMEGEPS